MTLVVDIEGMRLKAGLNAREHWRARASRTKRERQTAHWLLADEKCPVLPVTVRLVRVSPRRFDDDNLQGAFKAIRDGVADAFGIPDNDPRIRFQYDQERGEPNEYAVRIEITPATTNEQ